MYRVGVIGLGSIAAMYSNPQAPFPYCHVGGIRKSDRVELVAVADLSEQVQERFRQTWGEAFPSLKYYNSAEAMLSTEQLDIVAVCVRGPHHFAVMMQVIKAGPRAIFLEKPPTCSLEEMDIMVAAAKAKGIPITVSYSRHWAPHVLRLQELVANGLIGQVQQVVGYCGGSFLSFASHTTDLICQFAGYDPVAVYARGHVADRRAGEQPIPQGYEPEPELDAMIIEFASGVIGTQAGVRASFGSFYVDVAGTAGGVRAGIYTPPAAWDKDGHPIDLATLGIPEDASVFKVAYDQIAQYLDGGPLPHCTNELFTAVHEIGFAGIESVLTGQRIILPNSNRTRKIFANG